MDASTVTDTRSSKIYSHLEAFSSLLEEKLSLWRGRLQQYQADKRKVVLWGAGSKGVTFLNLLGVTTECVPFIVDLNPRKHGMYVPGTAQRVIAPRELSEYKPDIVIIMNPAYEGEIRRLLKEMDLSVTIACV